MGCNTCGHKKWDHHEGGQCTVTTHEEYDEEVPKYKKDKKTKELQMIVEIEKKVRDKRCSCQKYISRDGLSKSQIKARQNVEQAVKQSAEQLIHQRPDLEFIVKENLIKKGDSFFYYNHYLQNNEPPKEPLRHSQIMEDYEARLKYNKARNEWYNKEYGGMLISRDNKGLYHCESFNASEWQEHKGGKPRVYFKDFKIVDKELSEQMKELRAERSQEMDISFSPLLHKKTEELFYLYFLISQIEKENRYQTLMRYEKLTPTKQTEVIIALLYISKQINESFSYVTDKDGELYTAYETAERERAKKENTKIATFLINLLF